ncbi:hypothetical protein [Rhodococcus sp. ACPA1]|uniref:hypothetical protein n=1 Tax=Rhodococcus sp. ACPA1 TaxID=2028572 RepID=UPI000BB15FA9|nr:hypothetical protein [Rhodococcus sp. ACPA1]PBC47328.1 hypothetical protein CJ177_44465 [Rhodococcus sp. ACPA1]
MVGEQADRFAPVVSDALLLPVHEMNPKSLPQQVNTDSEASVSTAARSGTDVASITEIVGAARAILVTTRRRR